LNGQAQLVPAGCEVQSLDPAAADIDRTDRLQSIAQMGVGDHLPLRRS
jgi:hypothetical protein